MANLSIIGRDGFRLERVNFGFYMADLLKFRHKIFREQLHWVTESEDGLDLDQYDAFSDNYAVFLDKKIIGSVRITPGDCPFMVEHEFAHLLSDSSIVRKGRQTAEITRFAVGLGEDGLRPEPVSRLIYLALHIWALMHRVRWMYFVVEPPFFCRIQRLGFPVFPASQALSLNNGVMSMAAFLDWDVATVGFIRWLQSAAAASPVESPAVTLAQSRECDYLH